MDSTFLRASSCVVVALIGALVGSAASAEVGDGKRIAAVRAYLFYQETGTFGDVDLFGDFVALWNSPIGEGAAESPSGATLVLVDLLGDFGGDARLEATFTSDGSRPRRESVELSSFFSETTKRTVPFVVYGTGCDPLTMLMRLVGEEGDEETTVRELQFRCGE